MAKITIKIFTLFLLLLLTNPSLQTIQSMRISYHSEAASKEILVDFSQTQTDSYVLLKELEITTTKGTLNTTNSYQKDPKQDYFLFTSVDCRGDIPDCLVSLDSKTILHVRINSTTDEEKPIIEEVGSYTSPNYTEVKRVVLIDKFTKKSYRDKSFFLAFKALKDQGIDRWEMGDTKRYVSYTPDLSITSKNLFDDEVELPYTRFFAVLYRKENFVELIEITYMKFYDKIEVRNEIDDPGFIEILSGGSKIELLYSHQTYIAVYDFETKTEKAHITGIGTLGMATYNYMPFFIINGVGKLALYKYENDEITKEYEHSFSIWSNRYEKHPVKFDYLKTGRMLLLDRSYKEMTSIYFEFQEEYKNRLCEDTVQEMSISSINCKNCVSWANFNEGKGQCEVIERSSLFGDTPLRDISSRMTGEFLEAGTIQKVEVLGITKNNNIITFVIIGCLFLFVGIFFGICLLYYEGW